MGTYRFPPPDAGRLRIDRCWRRTRSAVPNPPLQRASRSPVNRRAKGCGRLSQLGRDRYRLPLQRVGPSSSSPSPSTRRRRLASIGQRGPHQAPAYDDHRKGVSRKRSAILRSRRNFWKPIGGHGATPKHSRPRSRGNILADAQEVGRATLRPLGKARLWQATHQRLTGKAFEHAEFSELPQLKLGDWQE